MSDLITKKDIEELRKHILNISYEDVLSGKALLKFPKRCFTDSGYIISMSLESYPDVTFERITISHKSREIDAASFDCIAHDIFGSEYLLIGSMSNSTIYHYVKFISGDKKRFNDFVDFMKKGARL